MALKGNDILVYKRISSTTWRVIAATRSNEIESNCETIEISSPTTASWRKYIAGRKSWSITVSYLLMRVDDPQSGASIQELLNVGNSYSLQFAGRNAAGGVSGTAILTRCKITATRGNLAVGTFTFKGTDSLTY